MESDEVDDELVLYRVSFSVRSLKRSEETKHN
jgi:hypothetical protein